MPQGRNKKQLTKRTRRGDKGFPKATIAFYGPDNEKATKVVCGIIKTKGSDAGPLKKWFTKTDIRKSEKVIAEVLLFIEEQQAQTVLMADRIIGCPHEEIVDYPEGEYCPECPFWKNRDRMTHEIIH